MPTLFTDRRNGHSRAPYESFNLALHVGDDPLVVAQNRDDLKALSAPLQFMNQVHGDDVVVVNELISEPTADALITQNPDIALAVMVADCIPLLLVSDLVIAAVHVGRRGLVNGIALKTVSKMRELGAIEIRAELGPSICGKCYEVPQDLADEVALLHPVASSMSGIGSPALDLPRALVAALDSVDVSSQVSSVCTLENHDYFSYRRHNITGRTAGVIWL